MGDFQNKAEEFGGKTKEGLGEATGNRRLEDEGKADQTKAQIKETISDAGEKVKDAANKVLGSFQEDKREDRP
ncbi:CsbD-like protein [Corynebacterium occultum]|uniref:CsbD-like protein n=1 Tax=Corynebacterium occultum TaxID=2675219 RepID=A0A6B8VQ44_9CORY|nr:CsbD family protein [Corynebacterium occultum]QGU06223.1 CsbD-like protein [Corynebacterium occultum]